MWEENGGNLRNIREAGEEVETGEKKKGYVRSNLVGNQAVISFQEKGFFASEDGNPKSRIPDRGDRL